MSAVTLPSREQEAAGRLEGVWLERPGILGWLTTVDHKRIGLLYFWTTLVFFCAGGVEALVVRTQLARPNAHVVSPEPLRRALHDARRDDDLPVRHPDDDRCLRQLPPAADDRRTRHGVPAPERAFVLALPRLWLLHLRGSLHGPRTECGLVRLRPARPAHLRPRVERRFLRARVDLQRDRIDRRGDQPRHDHLQAPRAGHVSQPHAALLLRDPRRRLRAPVRAARADDRPRLPRATAQARLPLLRHRLRRAAVALAASLLALRPPRGLHHHPARVRHRDLDHPDVCTAQDDRLPARRDGRAARRIHRLRRLGTSHVRDRDADRRRSSSSRPRR